MNKYSPFLVVHGIAGMSGTGGTSGMPLSPIVLKPAFLRGCTTYTTRTTLTVYQYLRGVLSLRYDNRR